MLQPRPTSAPATLAGLTVYLARPSRDVRLPNSESPFRIPDSERPTSTSQ